MILQAIPNVMIFDVDGTLTKKWTAELLSQREQRLEQLRQAGRRFFIATNQGGPAWHAWHAIRKSGRSNSYPMLITVIETIGNIRKTINAEAAYIALHPGPKEIAAELFNHMENKPEEIFTFHDGRIIASYQESWRKPAGGMLTALIEAAEVQKENCIYVGDQQSDFDAAHAAGINFADAEDFFFGGWLA